MATRTLLKVIVLLWVVGFANAQILVGRDYYDVMKSHIASAKESVNVAMYFVIMDDSKDNPVNDLVAELVKAHQRGVRVKVVLEDGKFNENEMILSRNVRNLAS